MNYDHNGSIRSRKKMPPPPIPINQTRHQFNDNYPKSGDDDWQSKRDTPNINR